MKKTQAKVIEMDRYRKLPKNVPTIEREYQDIMKELEDPYPRPIAPLEDDFFIELLIWVPILLGISGLMIWIFFKD